jgi:hypothetical protein
MSVDMDVQEEASEALERSVALALGQDVRILCAASITRSAQAEGLPALDCLPPEPVRRILGAVPEISKERKSLTPTQSQVCPQRA